MTQIPLVQAPQTPPITIQPNYNAVKIDIHNPQVNAPNSQAPADCSKCCTPPEKEPVTAPIYSYPQAPVYEVPKQSVYQPQQQPVAEPPVVKEVPATTPVVPAPVIIPLMVNQKSTEPVPTKVAPTSPVASTAPVAAAPVVTPVSPVAAAAQTVEVKTPEVIKPQLDLNEFINKLTSPDYEVQATTMESIADLAQNSPQKATELIDVKVIDSLLNIMQADTSKLAGPTAQQIDIRNKIMSGKTVTEAETAEANKMTPMELAEKNKQYSMYTVAILQKLYTSEIEKINNAVVPLTELPGAAGIVEQTKNNPNPMVRTSAIEALSYIQRPEYKQDLTTIFTIAQKDKDANVQKAATKALEKLAQVADAPADVPATPAQSAPQAEVKPEDKKTA